MAAVGEDHDPGPGGCRPDRRPHGQDRRDVHDRHRSAPGRQPGGVVGVLAPHGVGLTDRRQHPRVGGGGDGGQTVQLRRRRRRPEADQTLRGQAETRPDVQDQGGLRLGPAHVGRGHQTGGGLGDDQMGEAVRPGARPRLPVIGPDPHVDAGGPQGGDGGDGEVSVGDEEGDRSRRGHGHQVGGEPPHGGALEVARLAAQPAGEDQDPGPPVRWCHPVSPRGGGARPGPGGGDGGPADPGAPRVGPARRRPARRSAELRPARP
jgi:hypothetical protein